MKYLKLLGGLLLLLPLTACSSIGEKNTDMAYIYGAITLLSLLLLVAYCIFQKKKTHWFLLLFSSVLVVNLGYFSLSISKTLEEALLANRISYLGSVFLPYSILMILIDLIKIKMPRWVSGALLVLCCIIFLISASPGYLTIYYQNVTLETINGVSVLKKTYGPWHCLYLYYLLFYFASTLSITAYAIIKKKVHSLIHSIILCLSVTFNIGIWLLEQLVKIDFEILSVSYIITELFLLVLFCLLDTDLSKSSTQATEASPAPSVSDESQTEFASTSAYKFSPSDHSDSVETDFFISQFPLLTPAERRIYNLYLQRKTTREILNELCITENTLKYHNKNLYGKLGVSSRKELYAIASQLPPEYTQLKL